MVQLWLALEIILVQ